MRIHKTTLSLYFHMSEAVVDIWHSQHASCPVQQDTFCFIAGAQKLVVAGVQNMEPLIIAALIIILRAYSNLNIVQILGTINK